MKTMIIYCVYGLLLSNFYTWLFNPIFLKAIMSWSIFMVFLFAPLFYSLREKKSQEDKQ